METHSWWRPHKPSKTPRMSGASVARDLRARGDLGRGFSRRNLFYMRQLAALWPDQEFVQPLAAQIGWTHHQVLLDAFGVTPDLYA